MFSFDASLGGGLVICCMCVQVEGVEWQRAMQCGVQRLRGVHGLQ